MASYLNRQPSKVMGQHMGEEDQRHRQRQQERRSVEDLTDEVDRLLLLTNAMWELLLEAWPGLTTQHLLKKMHDIDARDDVLDGTNRRPPRPCPSPSCGSKVAPGLVRCEYCGTEVAAHADPFVV